jgi:hypothetical protein
MPARRTTATHITERLYSLSLTSKPGTPPTSNLAADVIASTLADDDGPDTFAPTDISPTSVDVNAIVGQILASSSARSAPSTTPATPSPHSSSSSASPPSPVLSPSETSAGQKLTQKQLAALANINSRIEDLNSKMREPRTPELYWEIQARLRHLRSALQRLTRRVPSIQTGRHEASAALDCLTQALSEWRGPLGIQCDSGVYDSGKLHRCLLRSNH